MQNTKKISIFFGVLHYFRLELFLGMWELSPTKSLWISFEVHYNDLGLRFSCSCYMIFPPYYKWALQEEVLQPMMVWLMGLFFQLFYCLPLKVCLHKLNFEENSKLHKHFSNFIYNHKSKLCKESDVKEITGIRNIMEHPIDSWANYAFPCNPSQTLLTALGLN